MIRSYKNGPGVLMMSSYSGEEFNILNVTFFAASSDCTKGTTSFKCQKSFGLELDSSVNYLLRNL
jgi:hypothetical protein